jgi:hypothetical protein
MKGQQKKIGRGAGGLGLEGLPRSTDVYESKIDNSHL